MSEPEEQPLIVCLNYCRIDPDSGYCLTCGRPPIPVAGIKLSTPLFSGVKLSGLSLAAHKDDVSGERET